MVAVDALCHRWDLDPAAVLVPTPGARGVRRFPEVLRLADRRSGSPMETRIRLALVRARAARPRAAAPGPARRPPLRTGPGLPTAKLAIEHNGADHLTAERHHRDLLREQLLVAAGWRIVRFDAATVLFRPDLVVARVVAELRVRLPRRALAPRLR